MLTSDVRSGAVVRTGAGKYAGTIPQGQVGVYAGTDNSSVKIDDFEVLDTGRMKNIDGRWETPVGDISLISDKLEFGVAIAPEKLAVRRGFRGSKYVAEVDLPTVDGQSSGVLHYLVVPAKSHKFFPDHVERRLGRANNYKVHTDD